MRCSKHLPWLAKVVSCTDCKGWALSGRVETIATPAEGRPGVWWSPTVLTAGDQAWWRVW
eukprot:6478294-Amphidinium_carterae.1